MTKKLQRRILIQTIFFAACFLAIGTAFGYWLAMNEIAALYR